MKKFITAIYVICRIIPCIVKAKKFVLVVDEGEEDNMTLCKYKDDNAFWRKLDLVVDKNLWA